MGNVTTDDDVLDLSTKKLPSSATSSLTVCFPEPTPSTSSLTSPWNAVTSSNGAVSSHDTITSPPLIVADYPSSPVCLSTKSCKRSPSFVAESDSSEDEMYTDSCGQVRSLSGFSPTVTLPTSVPSAASVSALTGGPDASLPVPPLSGTSLYSGALPLQLNSLFGYSHFYASSPADARFNPFVHRGLPSVGAIGSPVVRNSSSRSGSRRKRPRDQSVDSKSYDVTRTSGSDVTGSTFETTSATQGSSDVVCSLPSSSLLSSEERSASEPLRLVTDEGPIQDDSSLQDSDSNARDSAYVERRRKNNEAAKRSRDARRHKERETAYRAAALEQENVQLRAELAVLRNQAAKLHRLLYSKLGI